MDAYPWFMIAAAGLGWLLFLWVWRSAGLGCDWRVGLVGATTALAGLAGGRAYALAEPWGNGAPHGGWLDGGLRLPGAVMGMLMGLAVGQRLLRPDVPLARVLDIGALAAPLALAFARVGCLVAGCCFGVASDLPWAMRLARDTQAGVVHQALHLMGPGELMTRPVHPLALYFMVLHLAVGGVLLWFRRRQTVDGQLLLLSLVLGQGGKAAIELLRQPLPGAPTTHLAISGAVIAAAALIGLVALSRARPAAAALRAG